MKKVMTRFAAAIGVVVLASMFTATAHAACGMDGLKGKGSLKNQSWDGSSFQSGSLELVDASAEPVVGLWKVDFIAGGNPAPGPPNGAVLDHAFVQWHADGTEIMNSGRNPVTQSFCLGVWQKTATNTYKLNHVALSWDPADQQNPLGPTMIKELVTVSNDGNSYSGSFDLTQYDNAGNTLFHATGKVKGTRITPFSPPSILFQN